MVLYSYEIGGISILLLTGLINALSTAHVPMTMYLFTDKHVRSKCRTEWVQNVFIPLSLVTISMFTFLSAPLYLVMTFMLLFVHYQIWHFGSQNIGVCSFSAKASQNRSITLAERRTIKLSTVGGMMAMISTFHPQNFSLDISIFPLDLSELLTLSKILYNLGIILTISSISYALYVIVKTRSYLSPINSMIYLVSTLFFVPVFISDNFFAVFLSYGAAHGLQYFLILGFHSLTNLQNEKIKFTLFRIIAPVFIFLMFCFLLSIIWPNLYIFIPVVESLVSSFIPYTINDERSLRIIMGVLYGVTLAHFWLDQNLWKLRKPETADWIKSRYPFLVKHPLHYDSGEREYRVRGYS